MNKTTAFVTLAAFIFIVAGAAYIYKPSASLPVSNADDTDVRAFVTDFGGKLKNVSLLAPDVTEQIAREYGTYVSPELLSLWQSQPNAAPGRQTSSPWPDRIEVFAVTPTDAGTYKVEGNVIEITSADTPLEPAAVYPVTLTVQKHGTAWVITAFSRGSYSELPKRQTIVGTWECLPHKDATGPQTTECAFGIKTSDGAHYAVDSRLMSTYPVDFPTGTFVRAEGIVTPVEMLNSIQRYDIKGIMSATTITKQEVPVE
jgi:hypothetical protein